MWPRKASARVCSVKFKLAKTGWLKSTQDLSAIGVYRTGNRRAEAAAAGKRVEEESQQEQQPAHECRR